MTTNFLKYCTGSADGMILEIGVSGVECVAGVGRMCIRSGEGAVGSGLLGAWAVALGSNFVGSGLSSSYSTVVGGIWFINFFDSGPPTCMRIKWRCCEG